MDPSQVLLDQVSVLYLAAGMLGGVLRTLDGSASTWGRRAVEILIGGVSGLILPFIGEAGLQLPGVEAVALEKVPVLVKAAIVVAATYGGAHMFMWSKRKVDEKSSDKPR